MTAKRGTIGGQWHTGEAELRIGALKSARIIFFQ
jgi:hypothetical protein